MDRRVPAARRRAVSLRVEPLSKAQRLAPDGRPSLTRARHHPLRSLAHKGGAGLRRAAPGRRSRQCSDQGCAFIAMHSSQVRPA